MGRIVMSTFKYCITTLFFNICYFVLAFLFAGVQSLSVSNEANKFVILMNFFVAFFLFFIKIFILVFLKKGGKIKSYFSFFENSKSIQIITLLVALFLDYIFINIWWCFVPYNVLINFIFPLFLLIGSLTVTYLVLFVYKIFEKKGLI